MATGTIQAGVVGVANVSVPKQTSTDITIAANARYVIFIMGYLINGAYMVQSTSAGAVSYEVIHANSSLTISVPNNTTYTIRVNNSSEKNCVAYCMIFNGGRPS